MVPRNLIGILVEEIREQKAEFCRRSPFNVEIPSAISDAQAKANAASKTWPGDMILG